MTWMQTYSGIAFDYNSNDCSQITIEDIAAHLSKICRFNGACKEFYSVAQHSVLVAKDLKYLGYDIKHQLYGLLHDAAEAYVGDIVRPFKSEYMSNFEDKILVRILSALGLSKRESLSYKETIKHSDNRLLITEKHQLMAIPQRDWEFEYEPSPIIIKPLSWKRSNKMFLFHYNKLMDVYGNNNR
jgi:uncharacterized protein